MPKKKTIKAATKQTKRGKKSGGQARRQRSSDANAVASSPLGRADELQPVPPMRRAKGGKVRLTSHKARSRWFQTRAAWPVREASVNRLVRERMRVEKALAAPANITSSWECVGPTNIGGRIQVRDGHGRRPA